MLKVANIKVRSFSIEYLDLTWEIENTTEDIQEYSFYVERSEAEAGPWQSIAGPLIDKYFLRDNDTPQISLNRVLFYRLKIVHTPSGEFSYSEIVDRDGPPTLMVQEIIRLENILFSEFVGVKCWLFPIRTFGQRCPSCYDDVMGKRVMDSCRTCWGTGFSGGYHYPIEIWAQIDNPDKAEEVTLEDHKQAYNYGLRTGPSPDIKPFDLIVDAFNRRMRVIYVGGTTRANVGVRLEIKAVAVQRGSIEDQIPLKVNHNTINLVPERNFQNAQTLTDSEINKLADVLGPYKVY